MTMKCLARTTRCDVILIKCSAKRFLPAKYDSQGGQMAMQLSTLLSNVMLSYVQVAEVSAILSKQIRDAIHQFSFLLLSQSIQES
jgi:hypothetical protein